MLKISIADNTHMEAVFRLRHEVFVLEQQVDASIERDSLDKIATHVIATVDGVAVGCVRVIWENGAHIGRFAVAKQYRRQGIGTSICHFVCQLANEHGCQQVWLNAQLASKEFYQKLGFEPVGPVFVEANMQHVKMVANLQKLPACK